VNVIADVAAVAPDAAVKTTACAVPGVKARVAGLVVTPAGSPEIETATVPLNEFIAVASTFVGVPVAPADMVSEAGERVREKSGAGGAAEIVAARLAEWVREPEVAMKVSVTLPAAAVETAVSVTLCALPGVSVSVAGLAVTPAGSPEIETATVPLNEFIAVASTFVLVPVAPADMVSEAGERVREKSAAGAVAETVAATVTEWDREPEVPETPEVPVRVSVALPATAVEAAVSVTLCAVPGVSVSVAGFAVTPAGSPPIVTATSPVKPFAGTAFTLICFPAPPAVSATVSGVEVNEKSAVCVETEAGEDPLLQDARATHTTRQAAYEVLSRLEVTADILRGTSEAGAREEVVCCETCLQFCN